MWVYLAAVALVSVYGEGEAVVGGAVVEVPEVAGCGDLIETFVAVGYEGAEGGVLFADGFAGC